MDRSAPEPSSTSGSLILNFPKIFLGNANGQAIFRVANLQSMTLLET